MRKTLLLIGCFWSLYWVAAAQSDDVFCLTMQTMLAETKTGFPSFKGAQREVSGSQVFRLKPGIIEGSDFTGGDIYPGEYRFNKDYNTEVKKSDMYLNTKVIGKVSFTQADTALMHIAENFALNLWGRCFPDYLIKELKLNEADKLNAMARVVISRKPILNKNSEIDPAAVLDEPYMIISLLRDIMSMSNDAYITVRFICINRKPS